MINFYDILGLKPGATAAEIKSAFRTLAKMYHPDKNPHGQEEFKKILRAYETLSNPSRRASFDLKLKYHQNASSSPRTSTKKNWSFEEKELKRRQYYDEHIKKYEKNRKTKAAHAELKSSYNEYKYILFATPIAVALLLLIMYLASSPSPQNIEVISKDPKTENAGKLKMGDAPYTEHFGTQRYHKNENKSLTIKNNTGLDVIVCLFNDRGFLRSCFIQSGFFAEIPQLPKRAMILRYTIGSDWDYTHELKEARLYGAFTKNIAFYKCEKVAELGALNEITLVKGVNEGFEKINEREFFDKY